MQQQALTTLEAMDLADSDLPFGLCLFDAQWHQGVIGILASRLKDKYHRPVIAFADAGNGNLKGSARSVSGLHIRDALDAVAARQPGLISKFGGHAMAAGLSLPEANFEAFRIAFDNEVRRQLSAEDLTGRLLSDGELTQSEFNLDMASDLREAGPWGQHFPEPGFHGEFTLIQQRLVGERHLKMVLQVPGSSDVLDAIAFNIDPQIWPNPEVKRVLLAYTLDINEFRGRQSLQLMVRHLQRI
jgi:single-stranded-DNA-specific exonuclease